MAIAHSRETFDTEHVYPLFLCVGRDCHCQCQSMHKNLELLLPLFTFVVADVPCMYNTGTGIACQLSPPPTTSETTKELWSLPVDLCLFVCASGCMVHVYSCWQERLSRHGLHSQRRRATHPIHHVLPQRYSQQNGGTCVCPSSIQLTDFVFVFALVHQLPSRFSFSMPIARGFRLEHHVFVVHCALCIAETRMHVHLLHK